MPDPSFQLRVPQAGQPVTGTPGHALAFDASGQRVEGVPFPTAPGSYTTIEDDGAPLPQESAFNIVNGTLADNVGVSTDLTLQYQSIEDSDGNALPRQLKTHYSADFLPTDDPAIDATRIRLAQPPLPAVTATDAGDVLAVSPGGLWAKAANAFLGFTTAALRDVYPGLRSAGMLAYVATTQCLYMLAADLTTWQFFTASPALSNQGTWFVDVGAAGDDNNSGLVGSPLKTSEELTRRLGNGLPFTFNQAVSVSFATGAYGKLKLILNAPVGATYLFLVNGTVSSTAAQALTAVTNTTASITAGVRGQLTIGAGAFTAKKRIRAVSGAHIGATTYSTGQNASPQNHFVQEWYDYNTGATFNVANGTQVVTDTLTVSFAEAYFAFYGKDADFSGSYLEVHDIAFPTGLGVEDNPAAWEDHVNFVGCEIAGDVSGFPGIWQCAVTGATSFISGSVALHGTSIRGVCTAWSGVSLKYATGCCFDGGGALCRSGGYTEFSAGSEWENGVAGNACQANFGSTIVIAGTQWGLSAGWTVGYNLTVDAAMCVTTPATMLGIPSATLISAAGNSMSRAEVPFALSEAGCVFSTQPNDTTAVSTIGATVRLAAGARGNVGATNVFAANPRAGMYRYQAYLAVTAVGGGSAGVPVVQAAWTDDSGVAQTRTVPFLTALDASVVGGSGGVIDIETNGTSQVQYSVIGITTQGALQYSLRVNCRIESPG